MFANRSLSSRLAGLALASACLLAAAPASADFVSLGGGSDAGLPLYRTLVFGGIDTQAGISPGYLSQDIVDGVDYVSNTAPMNASGGGTRSANGGTISANAWSADSGFMAARNHVTMGVSNAQAGDDYYMVAGQGGTRQVHLEANAPVAAGTFTWNITGTTSTTGLGTANARLDFGATTSPGTNWTDFLFGVGETAMTVLGPGSYTYTAPMAGTAIDLYLYYWTSAFTLLAHDTFTTGSSASLSASFGSTYLLQDLQLFDAFGQTITGWTMTDSLTGQALFNQDGRVGAIAAAPDFGPHAVPEPGSAALMLAALLGAFAWPRRHCGRAI